MKLEILMVGLLKGVKSSPVLPQCQLVRQRHFVICGRGGGGRGGRRLMIRSCVDCE